MLPSKTVKIEDSDGKFIALAFNEAADIIKDRLGIMQNVLRHLDPQSFEPCQSDKHGYAFDSIHLDTYNRFAEKVNVLCLDPSIALQLIYIPG